MQNQVVVVSIISKDDRALFVNGNLVSSFDPLADDCDICDLAQNLAKALGVSVIQLEVSVPDDEWNWDEVREGLIDSESLLSANLPCEEIPGGDFSITFDAETSITQTVRLRDHRYDQKSIIDGLNSGALATTVGHGRHPPCIIDVETDQPVAEIIEQESSGEYFEYRCL